MIGSLLCGASDQQDSTWAAQGNVFLHLGTPGLRRDSVVNVTQLVNLDKGFFLEPIGAINPEMMNMVETRIRRVLGLKL